MSKRLFVGCSAALLAASICYAAPDGSVSGSGPDRISIIQGALGKLDSADDDHWTDSGLPAVDHMKAKTGLEDLKRSEISEAAPGFSRVNMGAAPSNLSTIGSTPLDEAKENIKPNTDPNENPNAGKADLGPYEGQVHTADQTENLEASFMPKLWDDVQPIELAQSVKDPIFLIEAAMAAMVADPRYSKNGELQQFMRHYTIAQTNIKAHQARLDARHAKATG